MQQQNPQRVEPSKVPEYIKKAAKKAAEFNSNFNRERMEERRAYFDLQTHVSTTLQNLILLGEVLQGLVVEQNFGPHFLFFNFLFFFPSDYSSPPEQIQGAGPRVDQDGALPCGPHTRTVPRILQEVRCTLC